MTNNIIQQARDILAKWRKESTAGPWRLAHDYGYRTIVTDDYTVAEEFTGVDWYLIVGTAGNPDLLDAWDEGLRQYGTMPDRSVPTFIKRVAAAIVAADKRMTS